jgi:hypothetical protein
MARWTIIPPRKRGHAHTFPANAYGLGANDVLNQTNVGSCGNSALNYFGVRMHGSGTQAPDQTACPTGKSLVIANSCPALAAKINRFCFSEIGGTSPAVPPRLRGAYRDRHERWVRDAVDAMMSCVQLMLQGGLRPRER